MSQKADIYDLVTHHCNSEQITEFLRERRDAGAAVHVSGTKDEVVRHLKEAVQGRLIPLDDVTAFLRESEENGNQHILFFTPNTKRVKSLCQDSGKITDLLSGTGFDKLAFPLYDRLPTGHQEYMWSDFREEEPPRTGDWSGKIYGMEIEEVFQSQNQENGEIVKRYREVQLRFVCLVRWEEGEPDLLQIRVPRGEKKASLNDRLGRIWHMLRPALKREDFSPWDIKKARQRLAKERKKHHDVYYLPTLQVTSSHFGRTTFATHAEDENAPAAPEQDASIELHLENELNHCERLTVVWLQSGSDEVLERDVRTLLGSRFHHEVIIPSRVSSKAVGYVTTRLREFNG